MENVAPLKVSNSKATVLKVRDQSIDESPNHFVALQITNSETKSWLSSLLQSLKNSPRVNPKAIVPMEEWHLTVLVCRLDGSEQVARAVQILQSTNLLPSEAEDSETVATDNKDQLLAGEASNAENCQLKLAGIGCFNRQVLFVRLVENAALNRLRQVRQALLKAFNDAGLAVVKSVRDESFSSWTPHLTLAKSSRLPWGRQRRECRLGAGLLNDVGGFGWQAADLLQLCSMGRDELTGYYGVLAERRF